jgi:glucoamylase
MITPLVYKNTSLSPAMSALTTIAEHMFSLMLRNIASDGYVFEDPLTPGQFSKPGCILASPSYPADLVTVDQDYVFNWTRDAAITAIELVAANMPTNKVLSDYINFANICQNSGAPIGHACYTIEGQARPWSDQSDGPALQTLAILQAYPQLDTPTQTTAVTVIGKNIAYLLGVYQNQTVNLWEEATGYSFFARAVQLRCFQEYLNNTLGIPVANPSGITNAINFLQTALPNHWDANSGHYVSLLSSSGPGSDLNADIVMASVYGAIPCTDTKLLASAAQLRSQFDDSNSQSFYPINGTDQGQGLGPMIGRYPGDVYDGDVPDPAHGHPWAPCSCNFAELYYSLAGAVASSKSVPFDNFSEIFFNQIGINAGTPWDQAVTSLQSAGDKILNAIVFHSDHLELSEQFDATSGYEKSVCNLTWSYASFLSAVRAK